jgi:hypothetical protein
MACQHHDHSPPPHYRCRCHPPPTPCAWQQVLSPPSDHEAMRKARQERKVASHMKRLDANAVAHKSAAAAAQQKQVEDFAKKGYIIYRGWATPAETAAATIEALTTAMIKPKGVLVSGSHMQHSSIPAVD